jgi:integrase
LRQDVHDRLKGAFERWQALRGTTTKFELKMRGLREHQDPQYFLRPLIFTGETLRSYDGVLKEFVAFAEREFGIRQLEEIGKREFRAFMDRGIERGLAAKTLHRHRSALAKVYALVGKAASGAALSRKYGGKIRDLVRSGIIAGPERATPSPEIVRRAIYILRGWDCRHQERTGRPRAFHLVARLQLETAARSVSSTARLTLDSLKDGNSIELRGKGGKATRLPISAELHAALRDYLGKNPGILADRDGYRTAWRRAVLAAGGRVTGTHGLRRRSAQDLYRDEYHRRLAAGASPGEARREARAEAVERLGHGRNRTDQAAFYLGDAA